jgi:MbtH protein
MSQAANDEFIVVVNDEEQYSIWSADRAAPAGWSAVGVAGTKEHCLDHIGRVWTDMRPLSLRRFMSGETRPRNASSRPS